MPKHICNKESEIVGIRKDVKYIRKAIEGNGEEGLIRSTRKNTNFRIGYEANSKLMKYLLGGGWLTTIVLFIVSLFKGV